MGPVVNSGRRLTSVAIAAGAITLFGGAFVWLLGSSLSGSEVRLEGALFGDAGHEKKSAIGSLHTREEPARLSSKALEVIVAARSHFRTGTELPTLTVELYRGTLLARGEVTLVIGDATGNGTGAFLLTTEPGRAIEQLNAAVKTLTHGQPLDTRAIASDAPQTLVVLSGQLELRTANQAPQIVSAGQTWPSGERDIPPGPDYPSGP